MATEQDFLDANRPAAPGRARSAVENLLPAGIARRSRSRPGPSPHMDRSISSLGESFIDNHGVCTRQGAPDIEAMIAADLDTKTKDALTPISNWAHLNYMKTQRNNLRAELKVHQVAGAEAKRSVTSLRRLAFRMAVNISIKERKIATTARILATNRKSNYLEGRDTEKKVEELKRALRIEEGRNKEILEALERASMLTLQYANPKPEAIQRRTRTPISPPASPTTRLSNLSLTPISTVPETPPRSTSSSWNDADWESTPAMQTSNEIRTSDSRLIRAKRDSDQALVACRQRIQELQAVCLKSKEENRTLKSSKGGLEKEIQEHQARIVSLEQARTAVEETLDSTRLQVEVANDLEKGLKQKLRLKNKELAALEKTNANSDELTTAFRKEKSDLEMQLNSRDSQVKEHVARTASLEEELKALQQTFKAAEGNESALRNLVKENESANDDLKKRLDRGSKYEQILQKKIAEHEQEVLAHVKKIEVGGGLILTIRQQLKQAEENKTNTENALTTLRAEVSGLERSRQTENDARDRLASELEAMRTAKDGIQRQLDEVKNKLDREVADKSRLQSELDELRSFHDDLNSALQAAKAKVQFLERKDVNTQAVVEKLHDEKAAIEADLKDARQTLFRLREDKRMRSNELGTLKSSAMELRRQLQQSKEQQMSLQRELDQTREARTMADEQRVQALHKHNTELRDLQLSIASLHASHEASEKLKSSLQDELQRLQNSNSETEAKLQDTIQTKADLETHFKSTKNRLESAVGESTDLRLKLAELEKGLNENQLSRTELEDRHNAVRDEHGTLQSRISELELALEDSHHMRTRAEESMRTMQSDGARPREDVSALHEQLNEAHRFKEEAHVKHQEALAAISALEAQLKSAKSDLSTVNTQSTELLSKISNLEKEKVELQRAKDQSDERLQISQRVHDESEKALNTTRSRLGRVEQQAESLQSELASVKQDHTTTRRGKDEVEKSLEEILKAHANLEADLATTRRSKEDVERKLRDALDAHAAMAAKDLYSQSRLAEMEQGPKSLATNATIDRELSDLRQSKGDVDRKLAEALALTAALEGEMASARSRLTHSEKETSSFNMKLSNADKELSELRQSKADVEEKLSKAIADTTTLEQHKATTQTRLGDLEAQIATLTSKLSTTDQQLVTVREQKAEIEQRLQGDTEHDAALEQDLLSTRSRLQELESMSNSQVSELHNTKDELAAVQKSKADIEERHKHATERQTQFEGENVSIRARFGEFEKENADVTEKLAVAEREVAELRTGNAELEKQARAAAERIIGLETGIQAAEKRLAVAEAEVATVSTNILEAHKERDTLRATTNKSEASESKVKDRLSSAEDELRTVQEANKRLEAILDRAEQDMLKAETAFDEREKHLKGVVEESQAKLNAAKEVELKHMRRLSQKDGEIGNLINENEEMHYRIGEHMQELSALKQIKDEHAAKLVENEKYISELSTSNDARSTSMSSAYDELQSQHTRQLQEVRDDGATHLEAELRAKDGTIQMLRNEKREFAKSFASLEQEVLALREDKTEFERVIAKLQEKIRHLKTLEEAQEPTEVEDFATGGPSGATQEDAPPSPFTDHTAESSPGSVISQPTSIGHIYVQQERPDTRASTRSKQEEQDAWASELERMRKQRNEAAIQLRDNKKERYVLRHSLKETDKQLHVLEKQGKPKRHRTLLKKSRPSTPAARPSTATDRDDTAQMAATPSRPTTSADTPFPPDTEHSRHTIHFSPSTQFSPSAFDGPSERPSTAAPLSGSKRHTSFTRPSTSHRPSTSALPGSGMAERPVTSAGERPTTSAGELGRVGKGKKRWSERLSRLFR